MSNFKSVFSRNHVFKTRTRNLGNGWTNLLEIWRT